MTTSDVNPRHTAGERDLLTCRFCGRAATPGLFVHLDGDRWRCKSANACEKRVRAAERAKNSGRCVDCVAEGVTTARRPAVDRSGGSRPGNRCVTHWRAHRRSQSLKAHARRIQGESDFTAEHYWALYALQGGKCYGCGWATGKTKRLAVDHDHELAAEHDHPTDRWCLACVRALLCGPCNQFIGRCGVEALLRLVEVLVNPPARRWLTTLEQPREVVVTIGDSPALAADGFPKP